MRPTAEKLLEQALELPEDARAELAAALLASLEEQADPPEEVEASWSAEIQRRVHEIQSGVVKPIPWEEARKMIFGDGRTKR